MIFPVSGAGAYTYNLNAKVSVTGVMGSLGGLTLSAVYVPNSI